MQHVAEHYIFWALESVMSNTLLVLDLMPPDKNGWQITRLLVRNDATLIATPIIMLTARVSALDN